MSKTIEFTEEELVLLRRLVHSKLEYLGSVEDPRCEEWMDLEKKLSDALGKEYVGWEVFVEALMERERQGEEK